MSFIKLTRERKGRGLTFLSKLLILLVLIFLFVVFLRQLNAFLCISKPITSKNLVVEGWLPDYSLDSLVRYLSEQQPDQIIITGVPLERGYYAAEHKTYADIAMATLAERGFDTSGIIKINLPRNILRDRTYATALALKEMINKENISLHDFNIYTLGCHARRSYLLFRKAFDEKTCIGIISSRDLSYDYDHWMSSSRGFRTVTNEALAWFYAAFVFNANDQKIKQQLQKGYYLDTLLDYRRKKNLNFAQADHSPLTDKQLQNFKGLKYFEPDLEYRVKASFSIDTSGKPFQMKTTTDRLPTYRKYARLEFLLHEQKYKLYAYQKMDFIDHPGYHDYLFLPLRDMSSGEESYGGGRYLDLHTGEQDSIIIDFNYLYNPYCSYNDRYSCPIPPAENYLEIKILAGEKPYSDHH